MEKKNTDDRFTWKEGDVEWTPAKEVKNKVAEDDRFTWKEGDVEWSDEDVSAR